MPPTIVRVLVQNFPDKLIEVFPRLLVCWSRLDLTVFTFQQNPGEVLLSEFRVVGIL